MGIEHHPRVATFQGFAIPSTPLDIALLGRANMLHLLSHVYHTYRSFSGSACWLHHLERSPPCSLPSIAHCIPS
jgi:hypothetical protein